MEALTRIFNSTAKKQTLYVPDAMGDMKFLKMDELKVWSSKGSYSTGAVIQKSTCYYVLR